MFFRTLFALLLYGTLGWVAGGCAAPQQTIKREQTIKVATDPPQANLWRRSAGDRVLLGKGDVAVRGEYEVRKQGFRGSSWYLPLMGAGAAGLGGALLGTQAKGYGISMLVTGGISLLIGVPLLIKAYRDRGKEEPISGDGISLQAELDGYHPAHLRIQLPSKTSAARLSLKPKWFLSLGIANEQQLVRPQSTDKLITGLSSAEARLRLRSANALSSHLLVRALSPDQRLAVVSALARVARNDLHFSVRRAARAALFRYEHRTPPGASRSSLLRHERRTPPGASSTASRRSGGSALGMLSTRPLVPSSSAIVAAFDLRDESGKLSRAARRQLSEYWTTILAEGGRFKLVPPARLRQLLAEQKKKSYKVCYESRCQIELGRALAAQKAVALSLLRLGRRCTLTARLYDLKTETAEHAASLSSRCDVEQLGDALRLLALRLAR